MLGNPLPILIAVFFITSVISVVTGSTSLITVPILLQVGVEPRTALATNMFALTLMSIGGTLPFLGEGKIDHQRLPLLIGLTLIGSIVGALLVLIVPPAAIAPFVSVAMIGVALFSIAQRNMGIIANKRQPDRKKELAGYTATLLLGIYGGLFSGGYVTLLTTAWVRWFPMTFIEAIATTKLINIISSLIATIVFMLRGLVDYRLGLILDVVMFAGGILGSHVALQLNNQWLRRIFLVTVIALAIKTLF